MDNHSSLANQLGATPGKLALIGVLAIVLCGVLYLQFGPTAKPASRSATRPMAATESTTKPSHSSAAVAVSVATAAAPHRKTGALANWHSPKLASIVEYDPFALPASFPQPASVKENTATVQNANQARSAAEQLAALQAERTKSEAELKKLQQEAVQIIIDRKVAVVGGREVHVGDKINGFTVISIDGDNVQVVKDVNP